MKKLVYISLSLLVIGLFSCKKPLVPTEKDKTETGDGSEDKPSEFVGTWEYTKINLTNGSLSFQGQDFGTFTGTGKDIKGEVVISEDPNVYSTDIQFTAEIDLSIAQQTQDIPVEKRTSTGTWTESNGEISLKDDNGNNVAIISSNSSKIVFSGNFSEKITFGQQGFGLDANSDVTFTIEK